MPRLRNYGSFSSVVGLLLSSWCASLLGPVMLDGVATPRQNLEFVGKAPCLILPPSRKRPLDTARLRAHCAQLVENGHAVQVVESLLNFVESLAERGDRMELTLGRLAQAQFRACSTCV